MKTYRTPRKTFFWRGFITGTIAAVLMGVTVVGVALSFHRPECVPAVYRESVIHEPGVLAKAVFTPRAAQELPEPGTVYLIAVGVFVLVLVAARRRG